MQRFCLLAGASASCLLLAVPAHAQGSGKKSIRHRPGVASAKSWTNDIIVTGNRDGYAVSETSTATRTDTPLIQVPQSVQVLSRTLLDEQDRRTLADALVNVAGVTPTRSDEVLFIPPIVRGFPAETYVDGLPVFAGNQQAHDPNGLIGVERVELLKGPSATLYGGGLGSPLGGLINLVSARPGDTPTGYLALRAGSFATWNPYGDVNVPLASGIAARIAGEYQRNHGWIDRVYGARWSIQPSVSFRLDPATDLLLQGQFSRRETLEYSGIPADAALAGTIDRNAFPGSPIDQPLTTNDIRMGMATLRHAFSDRLKLTVSGRYYRSKVDEQGSFVFPGLSPTGTAAPRYNVYPVTMRNRTQEATVDANLVGDVGMLGGTHRLLAGVSYDWTSFYSAMGLFVSDSPSGTIDLSDPDYVLHYTPQLPVNSYTDDRFETFAGYVQDQATYGPLHVTGGLRLTSLTFIENSDIGVANDRTYTRLSPRIGATLDLVAGVALFAGYATAFRAPFGFIGTRSPVPETSVNVEGGVKLALPGAKLSGTLAIFRQTRDNVVVADPANVGFFDRSGRQRATGVEVDLIWEPTPAFSLLANYARIDTRDDGVAPGDRLTRVPRHSGRVAARYRLLHGTAKGLSFGAGISAVTSRELVLPNSIAVPGYGVVDAQASYDIGALTLGLSVVNLGGRRAFDPYSYFGYPIVAPTQPRSAYATVKVRI
ncbi:MAG: TonB-dependent siderophore receptor [Sphingomonas sp.]|uniref:TonB-dependent siderophore receptor n=1 Tax=Sphingomonas sp. TaxID=28214 RepID=UPI000DBBBFC4|nr:TonB-dependent siderophore receptor [Sphingomonas sp.]PZU79604.1 MAG: TonB-dependent siderophore receptor [Sphingomonas sp.]